MLGRDLIMSTLLGGGSCGGGGSSGGGGVVAVSPKEVNFYDYDGTCVYAYTVAEAQKLSELPAGPEHPGLVFQGWNWSLEGVKGLTRPMNVGAMYTTDDGTTRLYITLREGRTSPMLGVGVNGTVTVDWGDGTEPDVLTGTNVDGFDVWTPTHEYAEPGDYVIRLTVDGVMRIRGQQSYGATVLCHQSSSSDKRNAAYRNALTKIEIGQNAFLGDYAFARCYNLKKIVLPKDIVIKGKNAFALGYGYRYFSFPSGMGAVPAYTIYNNYCIERVSFPEDMTVLPDNVSQYCSGLRYVTLPNNLQNISNSAFMSCEALTHVYVPSSVSSIADSAFSGCTSAALFDFTEHTAVPTLGSTSAFKNIPDDCEIRVPAALYDEWIAATNWATYAANIKAY